MTGFIDIHSHILPGVDDGCRTVEESLATIRVLKARGFVGSVCTPHSCWRELPENVPCNVRRWTQSLQAEVDKVGLDYTLWPGGEVLLHKRTIQWFMQHGAPTLGYGNCVLMDFWGTRWPDYADDVFMYLWEQGLQPIIAHPERMYIEDSNFDDVFPYWIKQDIWLQGNFRSITGAEQQERERERDRMLEMGARVTPEIATICPAQKRMAQLLLQDAYYTMASDAHLLEELHTRLNGLAMLEHKSAQTLKQWLVDRPRKILGWPDKKENE